MTTDERRAMTHEMIELMEQAALILDSDPDEEDTARARRLVQEAGKLAFDLWLDFDR